MSLKVCEVSVSRKQIVLLHIKFILVETTPVYALNPFTLVVVAFVV
jgi:hypothetical protein